MGADYLELRRIGGQPGGQQALCEAAADGVAARTRASLLRVRTVVLNDQLRSRIERWYPTLAVNSHADNIAP